MAEHGSDLMPKDSSEPVTPSDKPEFQEIDKWLYQQMKIIEEAAKEEPPQYELEPEVKSRPEVKPQIKPESGESYKLTPEGKPRAETKSKKPEHPEPKPKKPIEISEEPVMPKYIDIDVATQKIPEGYHYEEAE